MRSVEEESKQLVVSEKLYKFRLNQITDSKYYLIENIVTFCRKMPLLI